MQFRILDSQFKIDDGISYIKNYIAANPNLIVSIGCDSQNFRKYCAYVTAIALRTPKAGAHVIYQSQFVPKIKDKYSRLWRETEESVSLAKILIDHGINIDLIELDFNGAVNFIYFLFIELSYNISNHILVIYLMKLYLLIKPNSHGQFLSNLA